MSNISESNTTAAVDWSEVYEAVRCVQLVTALLSVLGSGSVIVCVMSQKLSRRPELQPLLLLGVSDLLLALCWLIGAAAFSERCSGLNTHCYNLHTVEQQLEVEGQTSERFSGIRNLQVKFTLSRSGNSQLPAEKRF
ncbi:unnamed protein product [Pleuronectes platessa]|uniref:Uncharacterized protein n=1 Tax=Pleuronectes platessa TaxID=8262 RepID=A0A9N7U6W0_PLEPL|nr:unnamed protein product [Pleuronectes platessa]